MTYFIQTTDVQPTIGKKALITYTIAEMALLREMMDEREMLLHADPPPRPDPANYGYRDRNEYGRDIDIYLHEPPASWPSRFMAMRAAEAVALCRRPHGFEGTGIASYKLCSNEGWLVQTVEVQSALNQDTLYRQRAGRAEVPYTVWTQHDLQLWYGWRLFLASAAELSGFEVW